MKLFLLASFPLYLLDQATKWAIHLLLPLHDSIEVVPGFFNVVYVTNTGAAFNFLNDSNYFFIGLSIVTLIALIIFQGRGFFQDRLERTGVALLMAGILGNLTDRIIHRYVIDFLDFHIGTLVSWPAFNVADSCICVAVGLFILHSIKSSKTTGVNNPPAATI